MQTKYAKEVNRMERKTNILAEYRQKGRDGDGVPGVGADGYKVFYRVILYFTQTCCA